MSFDIQQYYGQHTVAVEGIIQDGYNNSISSGLVEGYEGDARDVGNHDGQIGYNYFWNKEEVVLISDEADHARLSARLDGNRIEFRADQMIDWVQYLDIITGATYVEDVVVVGQRRDFPSQPFPVPETTPGQPNSVPNPCGNASTAKPWNADAAAAKSIADFLQAAANLGGDDAPNGAPTLSNREFGRGLAVRPDNSVWGNTLSQGQPFSTNVAEMEIDFTGITYLDYIGDIHTHPFGTVLPSQLDWDQFMLNNYNARLNGRVNETFYSYIASVDGNGQVWGIFVYEDGPRPANSPNPPRPTTAGEQVNPNAQPCP